MGVIERVNKKKRDRNEIMIFNPYTEISYQQFDELCFNFNLQPRIKAVFLLLLPTTSRCSIATAQNGIDK